MGINCLCPFCPHLDACWSWDFNSWDAMAWLASMSSTVQVHWAYFGESTHTCLSMVPAFRTCEKATWIKLSLEGKNGIGGIGVTLKVSCVCQLLGLFYEQYVNLMEFLLEISLWTVLMQLSKNCRVGKLWESFTFKLGHAHRRMVFLSRHVQAGLELV